MIWEMADPLAGRDVDLIAEGFCRFVYLGLCLARRRSFAIEKQARKSKYRKASVAAPGVPSSTDRAPVRGQISKRPR